jgi:hypothetical protein
MVHEEIHQLDVTLNEVKTILQRLIPGQAKSELILPHSVPNKIQLIGGETVTFQIPCEVLLNPCSIKIDYPEKKNNMTVWVSQTEVVPSDSKCDQKFFSPKICFINAKEKAKVFNCQHIHATFLSEASMVITATVLFGIK